MNTLKRSSLCIALVLSVILSVGAAGEQGSITYEPAARMTQST